VHLTLARSVIAGNTPIGVLVAGGTAILEGNTIENNSSTGNGGGIAVNGLDATSVTARHNLIRNNSAASGGGVGISAGSTALYSNEIVGNTATSNGGGVAAWANGFEIILVGNRIRQNTSEGLGGGGLYVGEGDVGLERNDIQQNAAPGTHGGGIVVAGGRVVGINDVIARNQSEVEGVYVASGSLVTRHWTLVSNGLYAVSSSGGAASFANTIVCSHTVAGFWGPQLDANVTLFYRNGTRCGDGATCVGDLTGTPLFVNITAGDYHITSTSVAIDKGIDVGVKSDMDLQPRFGTPDVGADEYWAPGALRPIYVPLIVRSLP
jgi:predicted outer membrane repeat protein